MLLSRRHSSTPSTTTHQARLNGAHQNSQQQNGNDLIMMMWRQKSRSSPVSSLPNEVWISIFEHLDTQALIVSAQVCRTWASLADTKGLWSRERVRPQLVKVLGTPITERLLNVYKAEHCRPKDLYLQAVNQVKDEMISTITQLQFFFRYTWSHKFFKAEAIINRLLVMEEQIRLTAASPTTHTAGSKAHCLGSPSPLHHPRISGLEQRRSSVPAISTAFLFSPGAAPPRSGLPAHLLKPMIPKVFWSAHSLLSHLRVMLEASDKLFDDSPPTMAMDLNAPDAVPNTSPRIIEAIDGMVRDIKSIGTFDRSVTVESWLSVFQLLAHQLPARTNCCVPYHLAEVIMRCCAEEWIKIDDFLQVVNDKHRLVETRVCNRHQDHVARFVSRGRPNATAASTPASASSSPVVAAKPSRRGSVIGLLNSLTSSLGGSSSKVGSPRTPLLQPPQCDHCHNRRAVGFVPICRGDDTGASTGLGSSGGLNLSGSIMSLSGGLVEDADRFVVFYFCSQCRESGVCSNCGQKLFAWESSLRPSNPGDCMECRCGHRLVPRAHMASFSQRFEPDNHHGPGPVEPMEGAMETEQDSPPAQTEEEYLDAIRRAYQEDVERRNSVPVVLPESLADDDDLMYESDHGEDDEDDDCEVDEEEEDGEEDYESDGSDG